ncbi:MAG: hypothetical protein WA952_14715 [Lewinella sp.]
MSEYPYRAGPAFRSVIVSLLLGLPFVWLVGKADFLSLPWILSSLCAAFCIFLVQYAYLINNVFVLGNGKLTIRRRLGPAKEIQLSEITHFRIEEHKGHVLRRQREMIVHHSDRKTRFNIGDLREEDKFVRTLEAMLGGEGRSLLEDQPAESFLQKQFDRLYR